MGPGQAGAGRRDQTHQVGAAFLEALARVSHGVRQVIVSSSFEPIVKLRKKASVFGTTFTLGADATLFCLFC